MNILKHEKKLAVLSALVEGNSVRAVSRMTGVHKTTILRLIADTGEWCAKVMGERMRNLRCAEIEADEIWCYVGKKQKRLTPEEKRGGGCADHSDNEIKREAERTPGAFETFADKPQKPERQHDPKAERLRYEDVSDEPPHFTVANPRRIEIERRS